MTDPIVAAGERLRQTASVTEAICALPAVATVRWCDDAAAAVSTLSPRLVCAVTICDADPDQSAATIAATGAAGGDAPDALDALSRRIEDGATVAWPLGDPRAWRDGVLTTASDAHAALRWRNERGGRLWGRLAVEDVMMGAAALAPGRSLRVVVVECAALPGQPGFDTDAQLVLRAVLPPLARRAARAFGEAPGDPASALTLREQEVLELLTLGKSVKQIAAELLRSPHTVHDHVKSLHRKLNASTRGELIARAIGPVARSRCGAPGAQPGIARR